MPLLQSPHRKGRQRKGRAGSVADVVPALAEALPVSVRVLRRKEYQDRIRRHLAGGYEKLFREFTGLRFEIFWDSTGRPAAGQARIPAGCAARSGERGACRWLQGAMGGDSTHAVQPHPKDRAFTCCRGLQNFWHPIQMEGFSFGLAVLQALNPEPVREKSPRSRTLAARSVGAVSGAQFERAATLLRLVIHDAVAATLAEIRSEELSRARHEAAAYEKEAQKAREQLQRIHPQMPGVTHERGNGSGTPDVVSHMLDFIHASYPQPISLKDFASEHEMNAAYLSTLFSTNVGVPFKRYLTDFRLERARELLRDPARQISDVAVAVGYADPNRFLAVFKAATGVCPATFRRGERIK